MTYWYNIGYTQSMFSHRAPPSPFDSVDKAIEMFSDLRKSDKKAHLIMYENTTI